MPTREVGELRQLARIGLGIGAQAADRLLLEVERQPELAHRLPPEDRAKLLRDLDVQGRELATLTAELVELAREDTTREEIEPVELGEVVAAATDRVRVRAPGIPFTMAVCPMTVRRTTTSAG